MANSQEWDMARYLEPEKACFETRKDSVGIQAADLVAREAMKLLDNEIGPVRRPKRKSAAALTARRRFRLIARDRAYLEAYRRHVEGLHKARLGPYQEWLEAKRTADNLVNRMAYIQQTGMS